jgi:rhodanese-related sulfurtransferase
MRGATPHAVLDLRERGAVERGHIFGVTSLPRRLLETRLPALVPVRSMPVVLCDEDGRLAALARPTLAAMGYSDVRVLTGGLAAWRAAGRPVVQGVNVPSKVFGERLLHERGTPEITPQELDRAMRAGADLVIVDARTPEEYARGCIPGAWSVPGGELALRIPELVGRPDTTVVVHCGGRTRSYLGVESLRRLALPNRVVALTNGTMGWELAGLALERGAARWAPPVGEKSRARAAEAARRIAAADGARLLAPAELRDRRARAAREPLYVLDVRTAPEYADGHVAGAVWAPGGQAIQATDEYVAIRAATIVLVCDGLIRSVMTAGWLARMGFPDVTVLAGGVPAWTAAGGRVERGHPTPAPFGYATARKAVARVAPGPLGDAVVLSVDPSDVYARGHVPGAVWVCRSRLELVIDRAAPDPRRPLVVTCEDGVQSTLAARTLARRGFAAVRVLDGGIRAWGLAGQPLETGPTRLLDEPDDVVRKPYERGRAAMAAYLWWEEALDGEGRSPHPLLVDEGARP